MRLERLQLALTAGVAATSFVSIFAAQLLLALALVTYAVRLSTRRAPLPRLPTDAPLLAFVVWTLLSAAFSADPVEAHEDAKKLVLFALLPLAVDAGAGAARRERLLQALLLGGLALTTESLLQYLFLGFDTLENRPRGLLGHYMTSSGLEMGLLVLAAARLSRADLPALRMADVRPLLLLGLGVGAVAAAQGLGLFALETERLFVAALGLGAALMAATLGPWPGRNTTTVFALVALPLAAVALLVSQTRSAWMGALVGLAVLAVLRNPRVLWVAGAGIVLVLLFRPAVVMNRLTLSDASSRDRYYMWHAGVDMIRDKPIFGQGPGQVGPGYPSYRWPEAPNPEAPHLHDNALQIAAERGLPALVWWLWLVYVLARDAWKQARDSPSSWEGAAALALLAAIMVAGVFEYNFGDSEILMVLLLASALPYAIRRERESPPSAATG